MKLQSLIPHSILFPALLLGLMAGIIQHTQADETTFAAAKFISSGIYPQLADIDGDSDQDVLAIHHVLYSRNPLFIENDGTSFTEHLICGYYYYCNDLPMKPADLDGDGDLDLILARYGEISWLENDGVKPPKFTSHTLISDPVDSRTRNYIPADMNNDGNMDVIASYTSTDQYKDEGAIYFYENNGKRPISFTPHKVATTPKAIGDLHVADMNGDGWMDVLIGTYDSGILMFKNMGGNSPLFKQYSVIQADLEIKITDLNGDGRLDILTGNTWQENREGDPITFTSHTLLNAPDSNYYYGPAAVGDLDHDGHMDVVSYPPVSEGVYPPAMYWFQNNGKASPTFKMHTLPNIYYKSTFASDTTSEALHFIYYLPPAPVIGDLNGDGNLDIVYRTPGGGAAWFRNQALLAPVTVLSPTESGRSYASGNKMDIYWRTDTKSAGTAVTLELWRGNKKVAALGSSWNATGQGHVRVTLPLVTSGGGYRIKAVSSYAPTHYWDFSDESFVIKGKSNAIPPAAWVNYH